MNVSLWMFGAWVAAQAAGPATPASGAAAAPATGPAPAVLRLAVYDLKADGVDERLARVMTDALTAEVRKLHRTNVVSMTDVRAMLDLEAEKQLLGCSDTSCLSEIADSLGVDELVIGSLAKVGDDVLLDARRIDQREAKAVHQVSQRVADGDSDALLALVGPAVEQLYPERPLRPGEARGVAPELSLRLHPPPLAPWMTVTVGVVAGALGIGTLGAGVANLILTAQLSDMYARAKETPQPGADVVALRAQNDTAALATIALGGATVVAAAGTAVMALFTDWQGYGAE